MSDRIGKGRRLRGLDVTEISLVDRGANQHAAIAVFKGMTAPGAGNRGEALLSLARAQGEAHRATQTQALAKSATGAPASSGHARALALLKSAKGARDGAVPVTLTVPVAKVDAERRQIAGWANVSSVDGRPVIDLQGDVIDVADLRAAAHAFITGPRHGKAMHNGEVVMQVVESAIVDDDTAAALSIVSGVRGWWVVCQVTSDDAWQKVKSGQFRALSIAGTASVGEA